MISTLTLLAAVAAGSDSSARQFFDVTFANIITWVIMIAGAGALWQKITDVVAMHSRELLQLRRDIDELHAKGSRFSSNALDVLRTQVAQQEQASAVMSQAVREFSAIRTDVEWIKKSMDGRQESRP